MEYWIIATLRADGKYIPLVTTLARSERTALKKYSSCAVYSDEKIKSGMAISCKCEIVFSQSHKALVERQQVSEK